MLTTTYGLHLSRDVANVNACMQKNQNCCSNGFPVVNNKTRFYVQCLPGNRESLIVLSNSKSSGVLCCCFSLFIYFLFRICLAY